MSDQQSNIENFTENSSSNNSNGDYENEIERTLLPDEIPPEWNIVTLGDLKEIKNNRIDPTDMTDENYVSLKHMGKGEPRILQCETAEDVSSAKYEFERGDILFGKLRPVFRKVAIPKFDGICSTDINVIRATKKVDKKFLFYTLFRQDLIDFSDKTSTGTRMPRADWGKLDELLIALPPKREQERIGDLLYSIDEKIETNSRINELLDELAQSLYKSWFVNFDRYKEFKHSGLGKIPVDFRVIEFGEICETTGGGPREKTDQYIGDTYNWLRPSDIKSSQVPVFYDTEKKLNEDGIENSQATLMPQNSILLTITGKNLGDVAINKEPMATNQNFMCIESDDNIPNHFMFNLIRSERKNIESLSSGTAYNMLTQSSFEGLEISLPPRSDMVVYEDIVKPFYNEITHNLRENDTLDELRDTLLPELMSGETRLDPDSNNEPTTND